MADFRGEDPDAAVGAEHRRDDGPIGAGVAPDQADLAVAPGGSDTAFVRAVGMGSIDDIEAAASSNPPLTTVRVFKEQLGEVALRLLVERIGVPAPAARYDRGAAVTRISTELVVRSST